MIDLLSGVNKIILRIKSNELLSHTLDEIEGWISEYMIWLFAKYLAAELQTLAEKMSNTIYRAAKVCSSAAYILANISTKIYSLTFLSIHLMYEIKFIFIIVSFVIIKIVYTKYC